MGVSSDNFYTANFLQQDVKAPNYLFLSENDQVYVLQAGIQTFDPQLNQWVMVAKKLFPNVYPKSMYYNNGNIIVEADSQLYISSDKGITWALTSDKQFTTISNILFDSINRMYVFDTGEWNDQTDDILWRSTDVGKTWVDATGSIAGTQFFNGFIDESDYLYTSTSSGIYRSLHPVTDVEKPQTASSFTLLQNYPNPVKSGTNTILPFTLEHPGNVSLAFYNVLGKHLRTIQIGQYEIGNHDYSLSTNGLPPGIYQYIVRTEKKSIVGRLIVR